MQSLEQCPSCNKETVEVTTHGTGEGYITHYKCLNENCSYEETFP